MIKKQKHKSNIFNHFVVVTKWISGGFAALLCFSLTYLVSPPVAIFAGGISAVIIFAIYELRQRRFWEKAADFKILSLSKDHSAIVNAIQRQSKDIRDLRKALEAKETNNDKNHSSIPQERTGQSYNSLNNSSVLNIDTIPKSILPKNTDRYQKDGKQQTENDLFGTQPNLSPFVIQEMLDNAIRQRRIDIFMQPIVSLPQRKTIAYEVLARLRARPGAYIPANDYINIARDSNFMSDIDTVLLENYLTTLKKQIKNARNTPFFINIESQTLKNKEFMRILLAFMATNRDLTHLFIFEMPYSSFQSLPPTIRRVMQELGKLGCRFSLEQCSTVLPQMSHLLDTHIGFLKIDQRELKSLFISPKNLSLFLRIKAQYEANGVRIIAQGMETENQLRALFDLDLSFGQGYLFGRPDVQGAFAPFSHAKNFTRRQGLRDDAA